MKDHNQESSNNGRLLVDFFYQKHHWELYSYALRLVNHYKFDTSFAKDLLQEFYIKVSLKWELFDAKYKEFGVKYLKRTLKNEISDQRKKMEAMRRRDNFYGEKHEKVGNIFNLCRDIYHKKFYDYMDELLDEKHFPVMKLWIEGYSYKEIADIMAIKVGTASSRISKARKILIKHFEEIS